SSALFRDTTLHCTCRGRRDRSGSGEHSALRSKHFNVRFFRRGCACCCEHRSPSRTALAACTSARPASSAVCMMWVKLTLGRFGGAWVQALAAAIVLAAPGATVAASLMVVEGARNTLSRVIRQDRPDIVEVKSRFNRALFETPRSGNLPPLTIPVYEPLIDPGE